MSTKFAGCGAKRKKKEQTQVQRKTIPATGGRQRRHIFQKKKKPASFLHAGGRKGGRGANRKGRRGIYYDTELREGRPSTPKPPPPREEGNVRRGRKKQQQTEMLNKKSSTSPPRRKRPPRRKKGKRGELKG